MSGHRGDGLTNYGDGRSFLHAPKNKDNEWLRPSERLLMDSSESLPVFSLTATPHSFSPRTGGSPELGDEYSLYRSRSASVSSSSSANSTGTVCESELSSAPPQNERDIVPFGLGIKPGRRSRSKCFSKSPKLTPKASKADVGEPAKAGPRASEEESGEGSAAESVEERTNSAGSRAVDWKSADACWRDKPAQNPTLLRRIFGTESSTSSTGNPTKTPVDTEDDSVSLVSTVSGSGIDFFRKFVQRKGANCKDCEDQFRREVLIDRLVADSQNIKAGLQSRASTDVSQYYSEDSQSESEMSDRMTTSSFNHSGIVSSMGVQNMEGRARTCASRCKSHQHTDFQDDVQSRSSGLSRQSSRGSSISGSGLLFLRNYLRKKKSRSRAGGTSKMDPKDISAFNIVPVPFPPPSDFYGPAFLHDGGQSDTSDTSSERRLSVCSTVADLLNEDFDCDDSELKNLDWEEWDEQLPDDISYDDLVSVISESFYTSSEDHDLADLCELDWEGRKTVVANDRQVLTPDEATREKGGESDLSSVLLSAGSQQGVDAVSSKDSSTETGTTEVVKSRYDGFKSSTFLQDLEAELELPPMTPVHHEKEEAVRAISKYIRTGSNSSYGTDPGCGSLSRLSTTERTSASRMSMVSPAFSDCLPELAPTEPASPAPFRRPLSQLLQYDCPAASGSPQFMISPSPDLFRSDDSTPQQFYSACQTPSTMRSRHSTRPPSQSGHLHMFTRPPSYMEHDGSPQEPRLRGASLNPGANRDSLLASAYPHTPPSPSTLAQRSSRPYLRHSSSNSTECSADSGCPLLEDKVPGSLSPTPSPRSNIETLSSNRNKLASFWEKSIGTGTSSTEIPLAWLSNKDDRSDSSSFKPFGSENCLSVVKNDRLSHFLDMTRRAAAEKNPRNRLERRQHRASTGSDCSDLLDRENPLSPQQPRRRESFTEYFV